MKKNTAIILFTAILLGSVGCSNSSGGVETSTVDMEETTDAVVTEELNVMEQRQLIADGLPDKDYDGRVFSIYDWGNGHEMMYTVDTETGDIVNDAVYKRKITIESRFNVKLETVVSENNGDGAAHSRECHKLAMAGDDTYELYTLHSITGCSLSLQGCFMNLYDVPYIDFEKPWWPDHIIDELSLMNQCYVFQAPISEDIVSGSIIYFFNRDMITDFNLEDPYTLVNNGEWTMDKLKSMIKDTYMDLNGNNTPDENDQYGLATFIGETYYSPLSAGLDILTKTSTNLELTVNSEKTVTYVEKMYSLLNDVNTHLTRTWDLTTLYNIFGEGRALFAFGGLYDAASTYRDTNINFGMIPLPKLDESQEDYITFAGRDIHSVPISVQDAEFAGIIIEAMVAEGYKNLLPAYYEKALKNKFVRDEAHYREALEAVDIIEQSSSLAFWYMYGDWGLFVNMGTDLINADSTDFASYYAKNERTALARINKIMKFFGKE